MNSQIIINVDSETRAILVDTHLPEGFKSSHVLSIMVDAYLITADYILKEHKKSCKEVPCPFSEIHSEIIAAIVSIKNVNGII